MLKYLLRHSKSCLGSSHWHLFMDETGRFQIELELSAFAAWVDTMAIRHCFSLRENRHRISFDVSSVEFAALFVIEKLDQRYELPLSQVHLDADRTRNKLIHPAQSIPYSQAYVSTSFEAGAHIFSFVFYLGSGVSGFR